MQSTTTHKFPIEIKDWLNKRTLTDETISRFGLYWNERDEIVIPIHDRDGNFLFNKYRKNPFEVSDKPKYRYERGANSVLFNLETLKNVDENTVIFIVEGELDCIALENIGIKAITTTGGAGTFEPEWAEELKNFKQLYICLDNDTAGIKGAIYIQSLLPNAFMKILPPGTKDVTEFLQKNPSQSFFSGIYKNYKIPLDLKDKTDKKEVKKKINEFKEACNLIQEIRREAIQNRESVFHLDMMNEYLSNRYAFYNRTYKSLSRRPFEGDGNRVRAAKLTPITNYINFNSQGYACCLWHNERTPSMFYNNDNSKFPNTVKCFSCGYMGDCIDVMMALKGVEFNEAVKLLTS
jgi:DNA primase